MLPSSLRTSLMALGLAAPAMAAAATDHQCLSDCTQRYSRAYCEDACSYGAQRQPTPQELQPFVIRPLEPTDFGAAQRAERESRARSELMNEQRRLLEQQRRALQLQNAARERDAAGQPASLPPLTRI